MLIIKEQDESNNNTCKKLVRAFYTWTNSNRIRGTNLVSPRSIVKYYVIVFFAGYFLFDGILRSWVAWNSKQHNPYWQWLLVGGVLSIIAGLVTLLAPNVTTILLLYYVAAWAIAIGAVEILVAVKLRAEISGEWLLIITGVLSVTFGLYLVFNPSAGIHTLLWLVATYAVIFGTLIVGFSLKLKKLGTLQ